MNEAERALIESAWETLRADFQNNEEHRRFIALCAMHGALADAGARYRRLAETDPSLRADAALRLKAVTAAALDQLASARTARSAPGKRAMWLMVGACGFVMIYAILTLLRVRSQ